MTSPVATHHVLDGVRGRPYFVYHFLLHQIETHRYQGHAQHEVHGADDEAHVQPSALVDLIARNYVPETDRAQRYETEIGTVQEVPRLPFGEQ